MIVTGLESDLYYIEKDKNVIYNHYSSISLSLPNKVFYSELNRNDSSISDLYELPINSPNSIQNFDIVFNYTNMTINDDFEQRYEPEYYSYDLFPFESGVKVEVSSIEYVNHYTKVSNISYNLEPCILKNSISYVDIKGSD